MAFGRGKSNHTLAKCVFFTNTVFQKSQKHNVVMKVLKNTIGKKIQTLVKENTLCCNKIRQEVMSLKRPHFALYHCVFLPAVAQILQGRLDSCFRTHIKKYMTPIHEIHVKMCVYMTHIKKPVQIHYTFGGLCTVKASWLEGHFFRTWVCRVRGT